MKDRTVSLRGRLCEAGAVLSRDRTDGMTQKQEGDWLRGVILGLHHRVV